MGDHLQLPPLVSDLGVEYHNRTDGRLRQVLNHDAQRGGLDESLFLRLSKAHPDATVHLDEQYRMNEDIMLLSNKLVYQDRLHCNKVEIAERRLVLPKPHFIQDLHRKSACSARCCWIQYLLDDRLVFLDV